MHARIGHIVLLFLITFSGYSQVDSTSSPTDTLDLSFVDRYDSLLVDHFMDLNAFANDSTNLDEIFGSADSVPTIDKELINKRLMQLDEQSPFDIKSTPESIAMTDLYIRKRRGLTARMLSLSQLYFPLFEERLEAYNMPLELKYLPIVESALKPHARSHAGAGGLWQFMPATGRSYGLDITSYVDERSDPILATEAACKYLSKMYAIYGDWSMALAAYNCGPGNVNKAIRRSGGKTDYWGIRSYLPKETQNYVPAFIAVNYVMNFHKEHNIRPKPVEFFSLELDTVHVNQRIDMGVMAHWLNDYNRVQVAYLNPIFKTEIIPPTEEYFVLRMPVDLIGEFIQYEDSIYKYSSLEYKYWVSDQKIARTQTTHIIKSGETLNSIAKKYDCEVQDILAWNTRTKIRLKSGRKLLVFKPVKTPSEKATPVKVDDSDSPQFVESSGTYIYHTVKKGDTLWHISQKYKHTSLEEIKALNSHLDFNKLKTGTKIKIEKQ